MTRDSDLTEKGRRPGPDCSAMPDHTDFFSSQIGGESVITYSYTDMPWKLLLWDTWYFFVFCPYLPWVVCPITPSKIPNFDEFAPCLQNIFCLCVHGVLIILQLGFIFALPILFILPAWLVVIAVGGFLIFNWLLCRLLNGSTITFHSDPKYAPASDEHAHEQWIFINGVAVGETWMKDSINRLALTFKRPVIGIHNQTSGVIFDVIECLIQRNFGFATPDVREAYKIIKETLYNPRYSKVVFVLHSQGGIEGGLVLDWLLQELPQDLLAKLEVYTFGNASNHFNNPHRRAQSEEIQRRPRLSNGTHRDHAHRITKTAEDIPVEIPNPASKEKANGDSVKPGTSNGDHKETAPTVTIPASDRVIGHIEHYAHSTDFVALWGVLHFVTNKRASPQLPRFIGRVFRRTSPRGGHQLCQHYLDGMFPLTRDPGTGEVTGCAERNEFMESIVELGEEGCEADEVREGLENSRSMLWHDEEGGNSSDSDESGVTAGNGTNGVTHNGDLARRIEETAVHGHFGAEHGSYTKRMKDGKVRVKDLSRLWLYRNGKSPPEAPPRLRQDGSGMVRVATL